MNSFEKGNLAQELYGVENDTKDSVDFEIQKSQDVESNKYDKWKSNTISWDLVKNYFFEEQHQDFDSLTELEQYTIYLEYNKSVLEEKRVDFFKKTGIDINELTIGNKLAFFYVYTGDYYESQDNSDCKISPEEFNEYIKKYGEHALQTILGDSSFMLQIIRNKDIETIESNLKDDNMGKRFFKVYSEMFFMAEEINNIINKLNKKFFSINNKNIFFNYDYNTEIEDSMVDFFMFSNNDFYESDGISKVKGSIFSEHRYGHKLKETARDLKIFYQNIIKNWDNFQYKEDPTKVEEFLLNEKNVFRNIFNKEGISGVEINDKFYDSMSEGIKEYNKELMSTPEKVYFPIGISSNPSFLDKENDVSVNARSLDLLAYLIWLDNQGIESNLYVIDTIQNSNYRLLYGLNENMALDCAKREGASDLFVYENYKNFFNLNNLRISNFAKIQQNKEFELTSQYISSLVESNEFFKNAFNCLVEPSILNKTIENNPNLDKAEILNRLSEYPQKEIEMILSKKEIKIGHEKEHKYDILAEIISVYSILEKNKYELEKILSTTNGRGKYNPKEIADIEIQLRNLSIAMVSFREFSDEYKNYLVDLSNFRIEYELIQEKLKKAKIRLENLEKEIVKDKLIMEKKSVFQESRNNLLEQKIQTRNKMLIDARNEFDALIEASKKSKISSEKKKELMNLYLDNNSHDKNVSIALNKLKSELFYKWQKEDILNAYSEIINIVMQEDWFDESEIPKFYYPKNITSISFATDIENDKEKIGFRKPYGTKHLYENSYFVDTNQILITDNGFLLGVDKLLCMDEENQLTYLNKVIRPFLIEYYINNFKDENLAQKKFIEDFGEAKNLANIFYLIEKKITLSHFPKQSQK